MSSKNYTAQKSETSLKFYISFRKYWEIISYLIIGFLVLFGVIISQLLKDSPNLLIIVLLWFSPLIIFYLIEILWLLIGREVVEVNRDHIIIRHQILGLGISSRYDAKNIQGVFISQKHGEPTLRGIKFLNFKIGKIAINYGTSLFGEVNTLRFGSNLEDWEVRDIVAAIHEKFPRYIYIPPFDSN
jgi:hypothetical protein